MADPNHSNSPQLTSALVVFLRVFWMVLGNLILAVCILVILTQRIQTISIPDAVLAVTIPLVIVARYLDVTRFGGRTAYGEPASIAHWRRYALGVLLGSIAAWACAHGVVFLLAR
jgi:hypothetical protein